MVPSLLGTVENLFAGCRKERPVCPSRARLAQSIRLVASASHALGRRHVKHSCPQLTTLRRVLTHRSTPPPHTQPGSRTHQLANRRSRNDIKASPRICGRCARPTADTTVRQLASVGSTSAKRVQSDLASVDSTDDRTARRKPRLGGAQFTFSQTPRGTSPPGETDVDRGSSVGQADSIGVNAPSCVGHIGRGGFADECNR